MIEKNTESLFPHGRTDKQFYKIYNKVKEYTMTTPLSMYNLFNAVKFIHLNNIEGDIVECGVWKGGSSMVAAMTLLQVNNQDKKLWLYDTFEGMPDSGNKDITFKGINANSIRDKRIKENGAWCYSPIDEVISNLQSTNFPKDKIKFIQGRVENTIPNVKPTSISLLRLDTDFYDSTYHTLKYLFPLLSKGGILIIDDYDCWDGAKIATDQYFLENKISILLHRMDAGRIAIKN